ncbi:DUF4238 domain-containing protein [Gluconobacter sp. Dm-62]|uniref:DUF4238 domain-containing protein n=1 Tax=Gluconobacter sp. Dm-62 TaxID=2799804 RepID=UPI001B8D6D17|nr:DUF4238 domain-containing protein [Gluconobacter sp. Dm-62]MBS1103669.1 DUF4238 domain-containing protein [Gluconobacter sp. Dm-62]
MAENKNQHYVPKFLLRRFSANNDERSINQYNKKSSRLIPQSSIDGQCSKPYFYGRNLAVERSLMSLEGFWTKITKDIIIDKMIGISNVINVLQMFSIQKSRTYVSSNDTRKLYEGSAKKVIRYFLDADEQERPSPIIKNSPVISLHNHIHDWIYLFDLSQYLLINKTKTPFIISDDPVVETNLFLHRSEYDQITGIAKAGFQSLLPISPNICILVQDSSVYHLDHENGSVFLNKNSDIIKINKVIASNSHQNFYFNEKLIDKDIQILAETSKREQPAISFFESEDYFSEGGKISKSICHYGKHPSSIHLDFSLLKLKKRPKFHHEVISGQPLRDYEWHMLARDLQRKAHASRSDITVEMIRDHPLFPHLGKWIEKYVR